MKGIPLHSLSVKGNQEGQKHHHQTGKKEYIPLPKDKGRQNNTEENKEKSRVKTPKTQNQNERKLFFSFLFSFSLSKSLLKEKTYNLVSEYYCY